MSSRSVFALGLALLHAPAFAASDVAVNLSAPAVHVYEAGRYDVTLQNVGNKPAYNVQVTIALPLSTTTPVVPLGSITGVDSRCSVSAGRLVTCNLGTLNRRASQTVFANIRLPYRTSPLVLNVSASTSSAENTYGNNGIQHVAALQTYDVVVAPAPSQAVVAQHCTGTSLSSFQDCLAFPSSLSSHAALYHADHTVSFPTEDPAYSGTWAQPDTDRLVVEYFELSTRVARFDGRGVDGSCFEGATTFYDEFGTPSAYMSMYRVCLQ